MAGPVFAAQNSDDTVRCRSFLQELNAEAVEAPEGYAPRQTSGDAEFRCEGNFRPRTSGRGEHLSVISFTVGEIEYNLYEDLVLDVQLASRSSFPGRAIGVRAVPLAEGVGYQMDASMPTESRLTWPAGGMLKHRGLSASKLGVYGRVPLGDTILYLPLTIVEASGSPPSQSPTLLKLRYPYFLTKLGWKLGQLDEAGHCLSNADYSWLRNLPGRQPITVLLAPELSGDCILFMIKRTASGTSIPQVLRVSIRESFDGPSD
jgi:hypothetical protein